MITDHFGELVVLFDGDGDRPWPPGLTSHFGGYRVAIQHDGPDPSGLERLDQLFEANDARLCEIRRVELVEQPNTPPGPDGQPRVRKKDAPVDLAQPGPERIPIRVPRFGVAPASTDHNHSPRRQEFIKFLKQIDAETPAELDLHLIVDNYATHKHPKVQSWLQRHRRFQMHFSPTSSSWLNLVERWFREITDKRIRRGVFKSVEPLIAAIQASIENHNSNLKPFVWTAKAKDILEKVGRARAVLNKIASE